MAAGESAADRQGGNSTGSAVTGKLASRIRLRAGDPVGESCACACYSRKVPVRTLCGGCASKPSGQRLSPISIGLARVRIGFVVSSKRYAVNVSLLAFEAPEINSAIGRAAAPKVRPDFWRAALAGRCASRTFAPQPTSTTRLVHDAKHERYPTMCTHGDARGALETAPAASSLNVQREPVATSRKLAAMRAKGNTWSTVVTK